MSTTSRVRSTALTDETERIEALFARAGQFCCTSYLQRLLREPGRKLGTVKWRIDYGISLLRKGEDCGTHIGAALRFCLARLPNNNEQEPLAVFADIRAILAAVEADRPGVEAMLGEALVTQRIADPEGLRIAAEQAAWRAPEPPFAMHLVSSKTKAARRLTRVA